MMESLYVALGVGGVLKVGRSRNPRKRADELRRAFLDKRSALIRFEAFDAISNARAAENLLIRSAASRLEAHSGDEWFYCRDFDNAIRAAREITDFAKENRNKRSVCEFEGESKLIGLVSVLNAIDFQEFWKRSRVPLRTLTRIKSGRCTPHKTTLALLEEDLKKIKPETKGSQE